MNSVSTAVVLVTLTLGLCACTSVRPLSIPPVDVSDEAAPATLFENSISTFALAKLVNDIDRGDEVLSFPDTGAYPGKSAYCNYRGAATYTYQGGREYLGNWSTELGEIFFEILTSRGYSVAGDPADLFTASTSIGSAEYLVGGRLTALKGNFCHKHHWWDGRPLQTYAGEIYVEIEWSVLNTLTKDVIFTSSTTGYAKQEEPITGGIFSTFALAFASAAEAFAAEEKIVSLASGKAIQAGSNSAERGILFSIASADNSLEFDLQAIRQFVVTIRIGQGHGSGFFVGTSGHVLTNSHVVGEAKRVQVITANGIEVEGAVIARDKARDIAVIKTPLSVRQPAPLRMQLPDVADEVYAVGTPIREELELTITKGIVSAHRVDRASGLLFIQADVPVSPGNSGGPLLDRAGNVVGISAQKYHGGGAEGLGLFIPLQDALLTLGIAVD